LATAICISRLNGRLAKSDCCDVTPVEDSGAGGAVLQGGHVSLVVLQDGSIGLLAMRRVTGELRTSTGYAAMDKARRRVVNRDA